MNEFTLHTAPHNGGPFNCRPAAAKYKELPGVRARRIKKLEAEARGMERRLASVARGRKFWTGGATLAHRETGERRAVEITEDGRAFIYKALNFCEDANMRFRATPRIRGAVPLDTSPGPCGPMTTA